MPALDDGHQVKLYSDGPDAAGRKEVMIGTKRTDAQLGSTDKLASFVTNINASAPVEKAYVDTAGAVKSVMGDGTFATMVMTSSVNTTAVGNVGASGPDDLISYTLPASSLVANGRGLRIRAWGTTANNANAKALQLLFGGTTIVTKQLTASVAGKWHIECVVYRTGTSAQTYFANALNCNGSAMASADGATIVLQSAQGTCNETETAAIVIKCQSTTSTNDNDVVQNGMHIEFL